MYKVRSETTGKVEFRRITFDDAPKGFSPYGPVGPGSWDELINKLANIRRGEENYPEYTKKNVYEYVYNYFTYKKRSRQFSAWQREYHTFLEKSKKPKIYGAYTPYEVFATIHPSRYNGVILSSWRKLSREQRLVYRLRKKDANALTALNKHTGLRGIPNLSQIEYLTKMVIRNKAAKQRKLFKNYVHRKP
jgi:hypothetical protein